MSDPYAKREAPLRCFEKDPHHPGVEAFRDGVLEHYGGNDVGIGRACSSFKDSPSLHHEWRAWDWGPSWPPPPGVTANEQIEFWHEDVRRLLDRLEADGDELARAAGLQVIIFNRNMWVAGKGWRAYGGRDSHRTHVHFGFSWKGALGETSLYQEAGARRLSPLPVDGCPAGGDTDPAPDSDGVIVTEPPPAPADDEDDVYSWRTDTEGFVLVDQGDGASPITLDRPGDVHPRSLRMRDTTRRWESLASAASKRHKVPLSWVLAVIYSESGGDPDAVSSAGAIGLMQIVPRFHPQYTAEQLRDPATNIDAGTKLYGDSIRAGYDLPRAASRYNAGADARTGNPHPSSSSPWGMRENHGYIENVVRAQNYFRATYGGAPEAPPRGSGGKIAGVLAGGLVAMAAGVLVERLL